MKILKEISTNPKYRQFNQIYFHAGDIYQYQKYGYLKTRMLEYPDKKIDDDSIFNNYNIDTTYQTFKYIFEKLKKGIYVSIRNNQLEEYQICLKIYIHTTYCQLFYCFHLFSLLIVIVTMITENQ